MDLISADASELLPSGGDMASVHDGSLAEGQLFVALSKEAYSGSDGPKTMRFHGTIQNHHLLILVDSGSSHSFLSAHIADKLIGIQQLYSSIKVQVADGGIMQWSAHLRGTSWMIQDYTFVSDLRILPLQQFDLILGMDWLESFSPMKIHWKLKWMSIPYGNSTVLLQGILPIVPSDTLVQLCSRSARRILAFSSPCSFSCTVRFCVSICSS